MIFFAVTMIYIILGILFGVIIILLPTVWQFKIKTKQIEIVAWPLYSAWGIGWVITGLWFIFQWPLEQYKIIFFTFHSVFPLIFIAAQFNHWLRQKSVINILLKLGDRAL